MFRLEYTFKSSLIQRYTLILSAVSLLLTFLNQISKINYIGVTYAVGTILLSKTDHIKYALSISGTGCLYDFFYVFFHSSDSEWIYIKCIQFIIHFLAVVFEIIWITAVYCYLKQQEEMKKASLKKLNWFEKQLDKVLPNQSGVMPTVDSEHHPSTSGVHNNTESLESIESTRIDKTEETYIIDSNINRIPDVFSAIEENFDESSEIVSNPNKISNIDVTTLEESPNNNKKPDYEPTTDKKPVELPNIDKNQDKI